MKQKRANYIKVNSLDLNPFIHPPVAQNTQAEFWRLTPLFYLLMKQYIFLGTVLSDTKINNFKS